MPQNNSVFADCLADRWHIVFAIPDHEWPPEKGNAAVRVCFVTIDKNLSASGVKIIFAPDHDKVAGRADPENNYVEVLTAHIPPSLDISFDKRELKRLLDRGRTC